MDAAAEMPPQPAADLASLRAYVDALRSTIDAAEGMISTARKLQACIEMELNRNQH